MGVPKFYRWLSERYPCLSEVVREHQIPEFDNLYLDMNGIIHICSHPNDDDPHFRITEEKIFESIFHYLDFLFRMVQPRKVFFLAVDGVAPRAKMNQQRGRRFRAAKEAEMNDKRAKDRGEALPKEARFDSNCITPGTPFMVRLQAQLKYFIASKISIDPLWQRVKVVLSGHETPGEGEHKIMDYIRYEKSKPGYDPNVRHCLYGLDADLIMLGLCSHDPHFSLLREEVRFGGKKSAKTRRMPTPEETTFHLLHLSLLREYLDHEFESLRSQLPFPYDLEAIIDDWILLGFLVGNDFIPHLPHLHINKGALHELYDTYKATLPKLKGYINCGGTLALERFETFMKALSEREMERFDDIYSDAKWLEGKTAKKNASGRRTIGPTPGPANVFEMLSGLPEQEGPLNKPKGRKDDDDRLQQLIRLTDQYLDVSNGKEANGAPEETDDDMMLPEDEDSSEDAASRNLTTTDSETCDERDDNYQMEFRQHKRDYYIQKMGYDQVDSGVLREQAEGYVRAIQWNLHYYYNGCVSWSWFYKHHYAPWITDIRDFASMQMAFEKSKPFLPFEQLLAVLPAASKELLPLPLQGLMVNETSPIIDYFPPEFDSDLNGKQQDWEAVVLIPFIEEKRLLSAMAPILSHLKPEEQARNTHGPMQIFTYSPESLGSYEAPAYFPAVLKNHARLTGVLREDWDVPHEQLRKGLMEGVKLDVFFPGFPTLKHLPHTASIKKAEVRVFEQASRGENMILTLSRELSVLKSSLSEEAKEWLGKEVWISWPHMTEARVVELRDDRVAYSLRQDHTVMQETLEDGKAEFALHVKSIATRYKQRWGIEIGSVKALLFATPMTGRKYVCGREGRITLEKQWLRTPVAFALHTVVKDLLVHADPTFTQFRSLGDLFPLGSTAFMLTHPHYGSMGKVVAAVNKEHKGRVQLRFLVEEEPEFSNARRAHRELSAQYFVGHRASQQLGLRTLLFSRITGTVFVSSAPRNVQAEHAALVNIGLGLKNNKRNEEVGGYTRRETKDSEWLYSQRVIDLLYEYMERFPEVFEFLCYGDNGKRDMFSVEDLFRGCDRPLDRLKELTTWLKDAPSASAARQTCGTETVEEEVVKMVEASVQSLVKKQKESLIQVKPHLLYKPDLHHGNTSPDDKAEFRLFDRVVSIKQGIAVPLGLKGTITGIQTPTDSSSATLSLEVLFDESFPGGLSIRSSPGRSYKVSSTAVINISYGQRTDSGKHGPPPLPAKHHQGQATSSKPPGKQKPPTQQQLTQDPTRSFHAGQRQASERRAKPPPEQRAARPEPRAPAGPYSVPPPTAILTRGQAARALQQQPQQPRALAQPPDPRQLPNPALFFPSAGGFRMAGPFAGPTGFHVPPPHQPPHQPPPACLLPNPLQLFGASPDYRMPFPQQQPNNPADDTQASFEQLWSTMTRRQQQQ